MKTLYFTKVTAFAKPTVWFMVSILLFFSIPTFTLKLFAQTSPCHPEFPHLPVIFGTTKNDRNLRGTDSSERICGLAGSDLMRGLAGNDVMNGNQGNDSVGGGDGNDILRGGKDHDRVYGDNGNDLLYGDYGRDYVSGGNGNDEVHGGSDNDSIYGGKGDDHLYGEDGSDMFSYNRGDGHDIIYDFRPGIDGYYLLLFGEFISRKTENGDCLFQFVLSRGSLRFKGLARFCGSLVAASTETTQPLPQMAINADVVAAGSSLTITGKDFTPNESIPLTINGLPHTSVKADEMGNFTWLLDTRGADHKRYVVASTRHIQTDEELGLTVVAVGVTFELREDAQLIGRPALSEDSYVNTILQHNLYLPFIQK